MKKFLAICLLGVALLVASVFGANQSSATPDALTAELGLSVEEATIVRNQSHAMETLETVMKLIESDPKLVEHYGGHYLGKGGLVVQFTVPVSGPLANMKDVTLEQVKYTYKELKEVHRTLLESLIAKGPDSVIRAIATDVMSNSVHVWVTSKSEETLSSVKGMAALTSNTAADDAVTFILSEGDIKNASDIINGRYHSDVNGFGGTIGFRARREVSPGVYEHGYISTGHVPTTSGTAMYDSPDGGTTWNRVGTFRLKVEGGTVDASFIAAVSGRTPTKTFMNYNSYAYVLENNQLGLFVEHYGATSGRTTGYITQNDYAGWANGIFFTNLIRANFPSQAGDSGAAVTWIRYVGSGSAVRGQLTR